MNTFELARQHDLDACLRVIDDGRRFQREQGFMQWPDDYPNRDILCADIAAQTGFVIKANGVIAGYLCLDFAGEPAYDVIEGAWHADVPYGVVHRMAFSRQFQGVGLATPAWRLIEDFCRQNGVFCIRVDTGYENSRMQHVLEKNGFVRCGSIYYEGDGRIAYDKLLL